MGKMLRILIVAASLAAVLALSAGTFVAAVGPEAGSDAACCGQRIGSGGQGTNMETVSGLTGLSLEEIQTLRHEGKSLVQIAATKGVTEQKLVAAIISAKKAEIQARVTAGTLTQELANIMLQQMEQNVVRAVNRTTTGQPEWAGKDAGQCAGNGQAGIQVPGVQQTGYGETGLCTGPGNMHKWGKTSR
jgi:hypothetical protein